jgi:twitching motility two-component system response regulator PilG
MSQDQVNELIKEGITAARAGDKLHGREVLRQALDLDPQNETGWLWYANVSETPEATFQALQRVLDINPKNERAKQGLVNARLQVGIAALKAGKKEEGKRHLIRVTAEDPNNELGWLWLAGTMDDPMDSITYLEKVLEINPQNEKAIEGLEHYRAKLTPQKPTWKCAICQHLDPVKHEICPNCRSILTLVNIESVLRNDNVKEELVRDGISRLLERVQLKPEFSVHSYLGIAYLNLKDLSESINHFQQALELQPHDALKQQLNLLEERRRSVSKSGRIVIEQRVSDKKRILIVDDSSTIRKLISMTMERNGYDTMEAGDGSEALDRIRIDGVPDLVILDIVMPGMDGFALCKTLRNEQLTEKVPIIILSGKDGYFNKMRARMAGANLYLTKPFQPEALLQVVQQYCPQNRSVALVEA